MTLTVTATVPPFPEPPHPQPLPAPRSRPRTAYRDIQALLPRLDTPGTFSAEAYHHSSALIFTPHSVGGDLAWQEFLRDGWLSPVTDNYAIPSTMIESPGTRARITVMDLHIAPHEIVAMDSARWIHCGGTMPPHGTIMYSPYGPTPRRRARVTRKRSSLRDADVVNVAGVHVTSIERTLYDLAHSDDPDAFPQMATSLTIDAATLSALATRVKGTYKHSNSTVALRRIEELTPL